MCKKCCVGSDHSTGAYTNPYLTIRMSLENCLSLGLNFVVYYTFDCSNDLIVVFAVLFQTSFDTLLSL